MNIFIQITSVSFWVISLGPICNQKIIELRYSFVPSLRHIPFHWEHPPPFYGSNVLSSKSPHLSCPKGGCLSQFAHGRLVTTNHKSQWFNAVRVYFLVVSLLDKGFWEVEGQDMGRPFYKQKSGYKVLPFSVFRVL